MSLIFEFRSAVLDSFKQLKQALASLENHFKVDMNLPAWFSPPEDFPMLPTLNTREQALRLIQQLEYLDHQKPREILVGAGLIAVSHNTLEAIMHLNTCKDNFKKAMIALKESDLRLNDELLNQGLEDLLGQKRSEIAEDLLGHRRSEQTKVLHNHSRHETTTETLTRMGLARLHLKQCYRRLPYFTERPTKVSWTWANTRAITRITVETAKQMLEKQGNAFHIAAQLQKLTSLSPNEPLAIVQELAPHLRANVLFKTGQKEKRVMVKGPVPLFYLAQPQEPMPDIKPPGPKRKRDKERSIRSDVKINPEPFLPSIRVHRYL